MGVFDKIKNALFEVEYVEVEDKPKKEKTIKSKEKSKDTEEKPIAKKIVLPGKREEKVEKIQEEEMKDDNFEIRPINENVKENLGPVFKFLDDDDFAMDDNRSVEPLPSNSVVPDDDFSTRSQRRSSSNTGYYDRPIHAVEANQYDTAKMEEENSFERPVQAAYDNTFEKPNYSAGENNETGYDNNVSKDREPYGVDNTTFKAAKDYGSYEKKDEKTYFKPSPIISPIYGILDKNYKKEDVVSKKEIRITTNYSRTNVNVDDIRDKAYGKNREVSQLEVTKEEPKIIETPSFEVEEEDDEPLLVDLSDEKEKPEVKSITVGDAMEYFDDLGLEYNVDYVDATNKNKKKSVGLEEDIKYNMDNVLKASDKPIPAPVVVEEEPVESRVKKNANVVEIKEESSDNIVDDDDNLFDLIDSMYKDENE